MNASLLSFLALALALVVLGQQLSHRGRHDERDVWCETKGAHMETRTPDGNLHITFWCVKDGRVVP